jgi:protocatechuate 3,4-dioxygenase beta subunit
MTERTMNAMHVFRWMLITILLASSGVAVAQTRPAVVEGRVVRIAGDVPIPNAAVELRSLDPGQPPVYTGTSDSNGRFAFRNVTPGRYQITAMRGGYVRGDYGIRGPGGSGITFTLAAGERLTDLRIGMRGTGTIAGRVTDLQGEPIGNVHVKALRYSYQDGQITLVTVKSVFTNDLGEYRLGWLPPGTYNVSAVHPHSNANPINEPEVLNSASILGTAVTSAGGMNGGQFASSGSPDPAIRRRLGLAVGEDYVPVFYPGTIDHRGAAAIDVRADAELNAYDMTVTPIRTATIAGDVTPVPSGSSTVARVQLLISREPSYNHRPLPAPVDASGAFSVTGLAPGRYVITASSVGGSERLTARARIDVVEGAATGAQLVLQRGITVPGTVAIEGGAAAAGIRLPSLRIGLRTEPFVPGSASLPSATPNDDGTMLLEGVTPGDYTVTVAPLMAARRTTPPVPQPAVPGPSVMPLGAMTPQRVVNRPAGVAETGPNASPRAYVKSIRHGGRDLLDDTWHVDAATADAPVAVVIGTDAGHIDGVAVSGSVGAAAYVTVVLAPPAAKANRYDLYRVTTTDAAGRFRIAGLPPDTYRVFAWEDVESGAWIDPQFLQRHESQGRAVEVAPGATAVIQVTVIPAE